MYQSEEQAEDARIQALVTLLISFFELFIGLQAARLDGFLVGRHESCLLAECLLGGYKTDLLWVHETALEQGG